MAPPAPESRLRPGAGGKAAAWDPRSFAQAPAGASCRTISAVRRRRARNRGPRGRLRGRRRREPPGNRSQAQNLFCGENGFSGGGANVGGPTTKQEKTSQAGRAHAASPRRGTSRGRRGRTAGDTRGWGWAHKSSETEEAGRRLPGAISCRACPGTGRRAGRHRAGADGMGSISARSANLPNNRQAVSRPSAQRRPDDQAGRARSPAPPPQRQGTGPGPAGTAAFCFICTLSPKYGKHKLRYPVHHHAQHFPYNPEFDQYTPDPFLPGRQSLSTIS